jgi:hypothetical protein
MLARYLQIECHCCHSTHTCVASPSKLYIYIRIWVSRRERLPESVRAPCTERPDEYLHGQREWQREEGHVCLGLFFLVDSMDASELGLHYTEQRPDAEPQDIVNSLDVFHKAINMPQALIILSAPDQNQHRVGHEETLHHLAATTMYLLVHAARHHNVRVDMGDARCQAALL